MANKISSASWRSYFSFFQGEKAENSKLFKDFSTQKKWKRTSQMVEVILLAFRTCNPRRGKLINNWVK
jgi:hypothetical protein